MKEESRINFCIRDPSPCIGCTERFTACSDRCPKDERGFGYKAWKSVAAQVNRKRRNYYKDRKVDQQRRELWDIRK